MNIDTNDNDFIDLVKGAAQENEFYKFTTAELESIYEYSLELKKNRPFDNILNNAIVQLNKEIQNRKGLQKYFMPALQILKTKKKAIAFASAFIFLLILFNFSFRYETEQVGARLIRYDRLMSRVEVKSVFRQSDKWHTIRLNNLQQAKAIFQKQDMENAAMMAQDNKNDEPLDNYYKMRQQQNLEDIKDKLNKMERDREFDRITHD